MGEPPACPDCDSPMKARADGAGFACPWPVCDPTGPPPADQRLARLRVPFAFPIGVPPWDATLPAGTEVGVLERLATPHGGLVLVRLPSGDAAWALGEEVEG